MHFKSIRWRIAVPYVILILATMTGLTLYVSERLRRVRLSDLETQLRADVLMMAENIRSTLCQEPDADTLNTLAARWSGMLGVRVTIIAPDGQVWAESHQDRTTMDNHRNRPEVRQALDGEGGSAVRYSETVGYEMMYSALRVDDPDDGSAAGVVRVALPLREIEAGVNDLRRIVLSGALISALIAALLAVLIAERTARPVRRLTHVVERMADGQLRARLFPSTEDEVGQLTQAVNHMAQQLREKISNLAEEEGRLSAILENMADGVLITDESERVQLINRAAAALLGVTPDNALDYTFAQVVRHHQLIELWDRCRESGEEQVEAIEFSHRRLFLQAIVAPFQENDAHGYLVILQDLTPIRQLETVRRDFISNISHELRTPLAGLKALVETLRDSALEDPPAARRFLDRIDTEVDTSTQMVQELLELSRMESGQAPLRLTPTPVGEVLLGPIERLRPQAERAELEVMVVIPPALPQVLVDRERVQQVVTNLVHNAIKFTPPGGTVTVAAASQDGEVEVTVEDTGVGIMAEDLPPLFERFFKADRARSGGGTGLGLAIAKHIIQGHGGRIWAESVEGLGSTFHFTLQAPA